MERLGYLYSEGIDGAEPDVAQSFEWFMRSALEGVPTAMMMTGYFLLNGIGTDADETEARKWLTMASDNGVTEATDILGELERR